MEKLSRLYLQCSSKISPGAEFFRLVLRICPRLPAGALLVKFLTLALKVEGSSLACGHLNVQLNGIEEIKDFRIHHEDKKESFGHKETNFENYCQF